MKKRSKKSFARNSKNAIFALLLIAAAIVVYGAANAATVSHKPQEIQPQGIGSTLDSDKLQGITVADIKNLIAAAGQTPSGMIAMFDTSCPSGWTRFTALDNRFPYGGASYGAAGGSATHTHGAGSYSAASAGDHQHMTNTRYMPGNNYVGIGTAPFGQGSTGWGCVGSVGGISSSFCGSNWDLTSSAGDHTHSIAGTSGSASSLPPYVTVVWCKKD